MAESVSIISHSGNKYLRRVHSAVNPHISVQTDVYAILKGFEVTCPARQHALKKLLCAGLRGKGSQVSDLKEAIDAMHRAVQLQIVVENQLQGVEAYGRISAEPVVYRSESQAVPSLDIR